MTRRTRGLILIPIGLFGLAAMVVNIADHGAHWTTIVGILGFAVMLIDGFELVAKGDPPATT
ncbi:MAG: hypothetical protein MUP97_17895 [Acidimicrobiia bacterium]|jgi:hypothetical protein|nr:hypothetical protein [Acidimicrobiia bacterium]